MSDALRKCAEPNPRAACAIARSSRLRVAQRSPRYAQLALMQFEELGK